MMTSAGNGSIKFPPAIRASLGTGRLVVGLDRDGTLVPFHPDPAKAEVPKDVRLLLREFASLPHVTLCVVSARGINKLLSDFGPEKLVLAGNYGLEIRFPDGSNFVHPYALRCRPQLLQARMWIQRAFEKDKAVIVEDHGLSVCIHFHLLADSRRNELAEVISSMQGEFDDLRFKSLPTSYEVLPNCDWDKGRAMETILRQAGGQNDSNFYLFAGDSLSDEPAFRWVNSRGGTSIKVGTASATEANMTVSSPADLVELMRQIVAIRISALNEMAGR